MKLSLISICFFAALNSRAQSSDYIPFYRDTSIYYYSSKDTIEYQIKKENNKLWVIVRTDDSRVLFKNYLKVDLDKIVAVYDDGGENIAFSLTPKKGEIYLEQERKSEVLEIRKSIVISGYEFEYVLIQKTWFGDGLYPCKYYYSRGFGLIRIDCEGENTYDLLR